jgi:DNA-binding transcriptional LysR family regulator
MELRHLRGFIAVKEEPHFAPAAKKLHIEQSPLSRAIKALEEERVVVLFARTTRSSRLTPAGRMCAHHAPRVFAALQQARDSVKAAAEGFQAQCISPCPTASHRRACPADLAQKARNQGVAQFDWLRLGLCHIDCGLAEFDFRHDASSEDLRSRRLLGAHGWKPGQVSASTGIE